MAQYYVMHIRYQTEGDPDEAVMVDGEMHDPPPVDQEGMFFFRDDEPELEASITGEDFALAIESRCFSLLDSHGQLHGNDRIKFVSRVNQPAVIKLLDAWGKVVIDGPCAQFNV